MKALVSGKGITKIYFGVIGEMVNSPYSKQNIYRLHIDVTEKRINWLILNNPSSLHIWIYDEGDNELLGELTLQPETAEEKNILGYERLISDESRYQLEITFMPNVIKTHLKEMDPERLVASG